MKALLDNTSEEVQEQLTAPETGRYAVRVRYTFSGDGLLSGVQVDGTLLSPQEAYNLEYSYIHEAEIVEDTYGISSISVPSDVAVIYGITQENLDAYARAGNMMYADIYSLNSCGAYNDTLEVLSLLVTAAALLLPLIRRLDISGMKVFAVPFEIPVLVLFLCLCSGYLFLAHAGGVRHSDRDHPADSAGRRHGAPGDAAQFLYVDAGVWRPVLGSDLVKSNGAHERRVLEGADADCQAVPPHQESRW